MSSMLRLTNQAIHTNKVIIHTNRAGSLHDDIVSANFVNRGNTSHDMSLNSDKQNKNYTET